LQDAANLLTLWDDGPTTICAYNGAAGGFGPCGQLAPQNAFYCSQDDSIAFDGPFLNQLVARFGMFAGTMVIGHEWGHLNQRRLGLLGAMGSYDVNFRNERQADCQAGIFAAFLQSRRVLMMSDAQATYMQFCALGNNSGWFDPGGHGDCPTRATAFLQGYNGAMSSLDGLCSGSAQRRRQIMLTVCPW
jgi:predicted metalloprotease